MDKVLQLIGIALKSHHLVCGTDSVIMNLQKNKLHLIFISSDASEKLIDKIEKKAFFYHVRVCLKYDSNAIKKITNKNTIIIAIDDIGLSNAIIKELDKSQKEESNL